MELCQVSHVHFHIRRVYRLSLIAGVDVRQGGKPVQASPRTGSAESLGDDRAGRLSCQCGRPGSRCRQRGSPRKGAADPDRGACPCAEQRRWRRPIWGSSMGPAGDSKTRWHHSGAPSRTIQAMRARTHTSVTRSPAWSEPQRGSNICTMRCASVRAVGTVPFGASRAVPSSARPHRQSSRIVPLDPGRATKKSRAWSPCGYLGVLRKFQCREKPSGRAHRRQQSQPNENSDEPVR